MSEFFTEYGLFLLKTLTIVVAIVVIIGSAAAASKKASHQEGLEIEDLNKRYRKLAAALRRVHGLPLTGRVFDATQAARLYAGSLGDADPASPD